MSDRSAEAHMAAFLEALGFRGDPEMTGTAARFAELMQGYVPDPAIPEISLCASSASGSVALRAMPFHSLCAHHLLPFHGTVAVAYQPNQLVAGFGSIPRLVQHFARQPQIQERLADQIADAIWAQVQPVGLVVAITARHMCVEMRGASSPLEARVQVERGEVSEQLERQVG